MKPPPLVDHHDGDQPGSSDDFNLKIRRGAEALFRLVSYFIYTALALGVMSIVCTPDPIAALVLFLIFFVLALYFWLYAMSLTIGPLLYRFVNRVADPQQRRYARWSANVTIVSLALMCGFVIPMQELIDAYVLQLFPDAAACDLY